MARCRNLLLHGLSLLLRRPGALFWLLVFSLATASAFSVHLHSQLAGLLDHSFAAASMARGFDLASVVTVFTRLQQDVPGNSFSLTAVPVFLLLYFVLMPGVLFCYATNERARLSTLLRQGLLHFWRFVRILIVALVAFGIILGPLVALNRAWANFITDRVLGRPGFILRLVGTLAVFLVASLLRLFFDLVEVYTVQLGLTLRPSGKPDRRTRRAYGPAWRSLRLHFTRAWGGFLLLSLLSAVGYTLFARGAIRSLAQPRAWPIILFGQLAVLWSLAMRLWQRGAQTTLALDHPILVVAETPFRTAVVAPAAVAPAYTSPVPAAAPSPLEPRLAPLDPLPAHPPASPVATVGATQPLTPPGDLPPEQVDAAVPPTVAPPSPQPIAPVRTVYDIDPFTPMPPPPNPISAEEEGALPDRPRDLPRPEDEPKS